MRISVLTHFDVARASFARVQCMARMAMPRHWSGDLPPVAGILMSFRGVMNSEDFNQLVAELSAAEQSAVREFILFLKERDEKSASFQVAVDEFITAHPDLLRRLAQ